MPRVIILPTELVGEENQVFAGVFVGNGYIAILQYLRITTVEIIKTVTQTQGMLFVNLPL